ncbi:MAG: NusG domain II-containing protein [Treponemataceae bacterium]|nr:NusG domain II-containing protein [Treponemataceae bacterium]
MKRGDFFVIILALILVVWVSAGAIEKGKSAADSNTAIINCRGEQYIYSLNKDQTITIEGNIGRSVLEIKDGVIYFTESPCRDHICENMGQAGPATGIHFIACLPNDVVVFVDGEADENAAVDY